MFDQEVLYQDREEEKRLSRLRDARALTSGRLSVEELRRENRAFTVSGARIDYSSSASKNW